MQADKTTGGFRAFSPTRRAFALTMLLLGLAVFCWGLHDKLSLYAPPTAPPPVAKAKLLSQTEQPSAQAQAAMPRPPRTVPPLLLSFFITLLAALAWPARLLDLDARLRPAAYSPPEPAPLRRRPPPMLSSQRVARVCAAPFLLPA